MLHQRLSGKYEAKGTPSLRPSNCFLKGKGSLNWRWIYSNVHLGSCHKIFSIVLCVSMELKLILQKMMSFKNFLIQRTCEIFGVYKESWYSFRDSSVTWLDNVNFPKIWWRKMLLSYGTNHVKIPLKASKDSW